MNIAEAPNVREVRTTYEVKPDGSAKLWYFVLTDLKLDVNHKEHDKSAVDALLASASEFARELPSDAHVMVAQTDAQNLRMYLS